ncbi:uncharacterized protein [Aristolochia californica]|uniref:uncharacterized protein n=1 Tax=Aristolochia californica TaxID=171875 RepID=UPI0035E1513D
MEGKGGCCIARYAGSVAYVGSKVDRIMLRYRPIAPKPAAGGAPPPPPMEMSDPRCGAGRKVGVVRARRRCERDTKRCRKQRKTSPEGTTNSDGSQDGGNYSPVVTLPLLPLTPERKDDPPPARDESPPSSASSSSSSENISGQHQPIWLKGFFPARPAVAAQPVRPLWSCVTVACVTDTYLDAWDLGSGDDGKRRRLEADTCPVFMTDAWNCVRWVNDAYKRMVGQTGGAGVILALATKEKLPEATVLAFSCRVRVEYTCQKEKNSLTAPCDVWRMAGGGCAWRLDVNTALSLGR